MIRRLGVSVTAVAGLLHVALTPVFAQGNPIVTPPSNSTTTIHTEVTVQVPPMDQAEVSTAAQTANQSFIINTVQPVPVEWANALCTLPNIWTTTPPSVTYENASLLTVSNKVSTAAFALIGLALAGLGVATMFGADIQERLGRVALGAALSTGNTLWWTWGIQLNNKLNEAISPPDVCAALIKPHIQMQTQTADVTSVASPVLVIVYAAVSIMTMVSLIFRTGLIDVLIAAGPLFLMCWADEHVEHLAHWYQRMAIGTLFGQVLLVIGLVAAQSMSSLGNGVAGTFLAIVILLLCGKLLSALSSQHTQQGGSRTGFALAMLARRLIFKVI